MNIGSVFKELITSAKSDAEKELLPLIATAATNLAANPTSLNIALQGNLLLVGAAAKLPTIGQEVLQQLAAVVNAELESAIAATATKT